MGEAIVITSGKGGVGKTTTTANVGAGLALRNKTVVMIDGDIGLRNLDVAVGLENNVIYDLIDVIEERCQIDQALVQDKRYEGLFILPASQTRDKDAVTCEQMKKLTEELKNRFDYVLIDCPAGIEQGFKNAIAGADKALVITTPEVSAVRDADRVIGLLEANKIEEPQLIINRIRPQMIKKGDMMNIDNIIDILAVGIIGIVPDDESIIVATNKGEPAVADNKSKAGQAYRNITSRILGEKVPIMDFEVPSFMTKVKKFLGVKVDQ